MHLIIFRINFRAYVAAKSCIFIIARFLMISKSYQNMPKICYKSTISRHYSMETASNLFRFIGRIDQININLPI